MILFNCTINNVGGGLKNSALFIKYILDIGDNNWIFAISEQVERLLLDLNCKLDHRFKVYTKSPAWSISSRKQLVKMAEKKEVIGIYTMAGPTYCKFSKYHIMGISNPYISHFKHADLLRTIAIRKIPEVYARIAYQIIHSTAANHFIFQTMESASGFSFRRKIPIQSCTVVPNAVDLDSFSSFKKEVRSFSEKLPFYIAVPGNPFGHKCIQLLVRYALELKNMGASNIVFKVTLTDEEFEATIRRQKGYNSTKHMFENFGRVSYTRMKDFYSQADIVFVPSVLETFSATYVEALAAFKPLVVSDRSFAREICGDTAKYVDTFDVTNVASTLLTLARSVTDRNNSITSGGKKLSQFTNQRERNAQLANFVRQQLALSQKYN
ncbi:glycosyltransferase [Paracoccaceae bacterium]|nr:glycosyltransferase [Paracoccaceae bacterium]